MLYLTSERTKLSNGTVVHRSKTNLVWLHGKRQAGRNHFGLEWCQIAGQWHQSKTHNSWWTIQHCQQWQSSAWKEPKKVWYKTKPCRPTPLISKVWNYFNWLNILAHEHASIMYVLVYMNIDTYGAVVTTSIVPNHKCKQQWEDPEKMGLSLVGESKLIFHRQQHCGWHILECKTF